MKKLLITLLSLLWFQISFAQPLTAILPKNNAYSDKSTVNFSWNELIGSINYTVEIAADPAFTIGLVQSPALVTPNWTSPVLANMTWYWRIIASDGVTQTQSTTYQFKIFEPNDIVGNTLWLAADSNLTMNGPTVASWNDLSGNGHNFQQSTATNQPLLITTLPALNDQPVLRFDGVSDFLSAGNVLNIGTNSLTTFMLVKGTGSYYAKFGAGTAPFNIYGCYNIGADQGHELAGTGYQAFNTSSYANYHVISFMANRASNNAKLFRNFNQLISNTITGIPSPAYNFTTTNPLLMGRYALTGSPFYLNGDVAEVIFYNVALSDNDRQMVQNHLMYKYAPPVNLGKDSTVANFCPINLNAPAGYSNLLWSTGSTAASISVNQEGIYWLEGTNILGVVTRDTIFIKYPDIPAPVNNFICVNESNIWNADMGPGFTYLWSTGETTPSISITSPGTYSVTVTDASLCTKNSGNYTFAIDTYSQTAYLGNDTSLCANNLIGLQIGAAETVSYLWPDGSTTPQYSVDTTGNYFVESININGCVAQDTMHVTISGTAPIADFSFQDQCLGVATDFIDQSTPIGTDNIVVWEWNMGDGAQFTTQNVNYAISSADTFTVELYVESIGGCGAFHTETVVVHSNPTADFGHTGHCEGQTVQFSNLSTPGETAITDYLWNFDMPWTGAYNTSIVSVPNRIFDSVLTYDVNLLITDGFGCQSSITLPVQIDPSPVVDFTFNDGCEDASIQFTNTSTTTNPSTYLWNFGDATTSIFASPTKTYNLYGDYSVSLTVTNPFACSSQKQEVIHIYPLPLADITHGPICSGSYVELTSSSFIPQGTIDSVIWVVNDTDTLYGSPAHYLVTNLGQQEFNLTVVSNQGCEASEVQYVDATVELNASFSVGTGIVSTGVPFYFENTSTNATVSLWNFDDGQFSSDYSPFHTYGEEWTDSILTPYLIVLNSTGCIDTAFQTIQIAREVLDLELSNLFLQPDGEQYIVGVKMVNVGTVGIEKADLQLQDVKGFLFTEEWEGTLLPGEEMIYLFEGKPNNYYSDQNETEAFLCVYGTAYDALSNKETLLDNNVVCKNIEGSKVVMLPINPNPAKDKIEIGLLISEKSNVEVDLVDANGKIVKKLVPSQELDSGTYFFEIDITMFESGMYQVNLRTDGNIESRKLIIANY